MGGGGRGLFWSAAGHQHEESGTAYSYQQDTTHNSTQPHVIPTHGGMVTTTYSWWPQRGGGGGGGAIQAGAGGGAEHGSSDIARNVLPQICQQLSTEHGTEPLAGTKLPNASPSSRSAPLDAEPRSKGAVTSAAAAAAAAAPSESTGKGVYASESYANNCGARNAEEVADKEMGLPVKDQV